MRLIFLLMLSLLPAGKAFAAPEITSSQYNAATGALVVTGTDFEANGGGADVDASMFTLTGEGGATYALTDTSDVEISSATDFTLTLSATDRAAIGQIINKNGTSATDGTTYNLAAADDWMTNVTAGDTSDTTGNGITVSNVPVPAITSAIYDSSSGLLTVTGTNFVVSSGANNDIDISSLTFTGGVGNATYTITSAVDVEIISATTFSVTLSGVDKTSVDALLDQTGTVSSGGSTYNLAAADDWITGSDPALNTADAGPNPITMMIAPKISSATYNAATGLLSVTGTDIQANGGGADIDASKFTVIGEGGVTYTLTDSADVERSSASTFEITLSSTDKAAVNLILNKNGTTSTGGTTYNLAASDDWCTAVADSGDSIGNTITVSNVAVPTVTSATYDALTGVLVVTGAGLLKRSGAGNDVDVSKLVITGEGGGSYPLTSADVEITSGTQFTVTLNAADKLNVNSLLNKNGTQSGGGTTYNLAASEDWMAGADAAVNIADLTGNGVTVSNVTAPAITSATYNASSGVLTVTGTNFVGSAGAANDVDLTKFTVTGEAGGTYVLTSASVEVTSTTQFTATLNATDRTNLLQLINKSGIESGDSTTYNIAAADDWLTGAAASGNIADALNSLTASDVPVPTIASATYNAATGTLVVTGANLSAKSGATNDIIVSKLSLTGQGGSSYTLTSPNVEITSATQFTIVVSAADKSALANLLNKNGTGSDDGTAYNLAAADDWLANVTSGNSADTIGNVVTVSGVSAPAISAATYDAATGLLIVTGTAFTAKAGQSNDINVAKLSLTGEGGLSYTLTSSNVEVTSAVNFTVTLNAADKLFINGLLNKNGTNSDDGTNYNLAAADDWLANMTSGDTSDTTGNSITVSNVTPPMLTSAIYDAAAGTISVTGSNFTAFIGAANDIVSAKFTYTGKGGAAYPLSNTGNTDVESATKFVLTLSAEDKAQVDELIDQNGTGSKDGTAYTLAAADNWLAAAASSADISSNAAVTVQNFSGTSPTPTPPPSEGGSALRGKIVVGGVPQAGVIVYAPNLGVAITNGNGDFQISGAEPGTTYTVYFQRTGLEFAQEQYTLDSTAALEVTAIVFDYNPKNCSENDLSELLIRAGAKAQNIYELAEASLNRLGRNEGNNLRGRITDNFNQYLGQSRQIPEIVLDCAAIPDSGCSRSSHVKLKRRLRRLVVILGKIAKKIDRKLVRTIGRSPMRSETFRSKISRNVRASKRALRKLPGATDSCANAG